MPDIGARTPAPEGFLLVDKPSGPTSHDVVGRIRAVLRTRRVGHAGTLDPAATGLLVLAVGRATKLLGHLALTDKRYTATIRLGVATSTDDAEGDVIAATSAASVTEAALGAAMAELTGEVLQVPSAVSAIKVDGRRAYERVRAGEEVHLAARPVTVSRFETVAPARRRGDVIDLDVAVDCSTGTYIRALARDLGASLGIGGHVTTLRRIAVGPFDVAEAVDVYPDGVPPRGAPRGAIDEELRVRVAGSVLPVDEVAARAFAVRVVGEQETRELRHGRPIAAIGRAGTYACCDRGALVALVTESEGRARTVLGWQAAG